MAWGAKALPGGGYWSMPKPSMPGALLVGDSGGHGRHDRAQGRPPLHPGRASTPAEAIYAALKAGSTDLTAYEEAVEDGPIGKELYKVRNARQPMALKGFIKGAPLSNLAVASKGKLPPGKLSWHRDDAAEMFIGDTKDRYPKPDGKYIFDKLSSRLHHGQRDARRRAEPHPRAEERPARDRRDVEVDVPRGRVRDPRRRARGRATST